MKQQLNEIKRMQQLAGILKENEQIVTKNYVVYDRDGSRADLATGSKDEIIDKMIDIIHANPENWGFDVRNNQVFDSVDGELIDADPREYIWTRLTGEEDENGLGGDWLVREV